MYSCGLVFYDLEFILNLFRKSKRTSNQTMEKFRDNDPHFATKASHSGQEPEQWNSMAVVPPISLSTTFKQDGPAEFKM